MKQCRSKAGWSARMVVAQLLVERGSFRDQSQDWGAHQFLALPSPGDRITVRHEDETHYLTVLCVHHQPIAPAEVGRASTPLANVVAKWTGVA